MPTEHRVAAEEADATLAAVVRQALEGVPWSRARALVQTGRVRVDGQTADDPALRMREGQHVEVLLEAPKRRAGVLPPEAIVYVDRDVVVVHKPAGLLTVPYDAERDTLVDQARAALRRMRTTGQAPDASLGVVQRLDKDTTGLLVFPRTLAAKRHLQQQLRDRTVERRYLALVHGHARSSTYDSRFVPNRGDGLRGSWGSRAGHGRTPPPGSQRAITHVELIEQFAEASLVACRLETGRQHQIRIHLSEAGHPLLGEPVYIRDFVGPRVEAPRPMLHAEVLGFEHPRLARPVRWKVPPPEDFQQVWARLRNEKPRTESPRAEKSRARSKS